MNHCNTDVKSVQVELSFFSDMYIPIKYTRRRFQIYQRIGRDHRVYDILIAVVSEL